MTENGHRRGGNGGIAEAVSAALEQFEVLTHLEPIGTTGVRREEDGWKDDETAALRERVAQLEELVRKAGLDQDGGAP